MIGVLFLCWIAARYSLSQTVTWTVETAVPIFGQPLKLACAVSPDCCNSSLRIWEGSTGTQIINNGISSNPAKYEEEWDGGTAGFNLIINNLDSNDVNKDYNCKYKFGNDRHTLAQDATWESHVESKECPIKIKEGPKISTSILSGGLSITRSAPEPTFFATYGGKNLTVDFTKNGPTNFDTWFYNLTIEGDIEINCEPDDQFTLGVITGTKTTRICDNVNFCECLKCGGQIFGISIILPVLGALGSLLVIELLYERCIKSGDSHKKGSQTRTVVMMVAVFLAELAIHYISLAMLIAMLACPCEETWLWYLIVFVPLFYGLLFIGSIHILCEIDFEYLNATHRKKWYFGVVTGGFPLIYTAAIDRECYKRDDKNTCEKGLQTAGLVVLAILILPIPLLIVYFTYFKGDDKSICEKLLRYAGLAVLAILILPIPFLIYYFCCLKANSCKEGNEDANLGPDGATEML